MDFLKCGNVRWKWPEKRNKPNVVATTAKHPDSRSQISRYGWMQRTYIGSVTFWGKFTSSNRISASRSDLLKLPNSSLCNKVAQVLIFCFERLQFLKVLWREILVTFTWTFFYTFLNLLQFCFSLTSLSFIILNSTQTYRIFKLNPQDTFI